MLRSMIEGLTSGMIPDLPKPNGLEELKGLESFILNHPQPKVKNIF